MSGSNIYWLDDKSELSIGKGQSVAYGQKIPEDILKKIHPKTLERLQNDKLIGSLPTPGRIAGAADLQRKIGELEETVRSQAEQAGKVVGLEEELIKSKDDAAKAVERANGQLNVVGAENTTLKAEVETLTKERDEAVARASNASDLERENKKLEEDAVAAASSLETLKKNHSDAMAAKSEDIKQLKADLKAAKK